MVMGDFNDNILTGLTICKYMDPKGFIQYVTHETTEKGTLIDHIYVKTTQFQVEYTVILTYFSDHEGILCSLKRPNSQCEISDAEMMLVDEFLDEESCFKNDFD